MAENKANDLVNINLAEELVSLDSQSANSEESEIIDSSTSRKIHKRKSLIVKAIILNEKKKDEDESNTTERNVS